MELNQDHRTNVCYLNRNYIVDLAGGNSYHMLTVRAIYMSIINTRLLSTHQVPGSMAISLLGLEWQKCRPANAFPKDIIIMRRAVSIFNMFKSVYRHVRRPSS